MTRPGPDLVRAVRAGCDAADLHFTCFWPDCRCTKWPKAIRAALAELAGPSEEMLDAADGVRASVNSLVNSEETWRAMWRVVLGGNRD